MWAGNGFYQVAQRFYRYGEHRLVALGAVGRGLGLAATQQGGAQAEE